MIAYPVKDLDKAKAIFSKFLGVEPYAKIPGVIAYIDVDDISSFLQDLSGMGVELVENPRGVVETERGIRQKKLKRSI